MFDTIGNPRKRALLAAFSESGVVKEAAALAGVTRESHYDWKASDPEYAEAFETARKLAADALEDEAMQRAMDPNRKSDKLLYSMLAAAKPERYGKKLELSGDVKLKHAVDFSAFSDEELDALERLANKAGAVRPRSDPSGTPAAQTEQAFDVVSIVGDV